MANLLTDDFLQASPFIKEAMESLDDDEDMDSEDD